MQQQRTKLAYAKGTKITAIAFLLLRAPSFRGLHAPHGRSSLCGPLLQTANCNEFSRWLISGRNSASRPHFIVRRCYGVMIAHAITFGRLVLNGIH